MGEDKGSALAWPCPIAKSVLSMCTRSMCLAPALKPGDSRMICFQSGIGFPYFASMEGKYDAGPCTFSLF